MRIRYNAALQLREETKVVDALVGLAAIDPALALDGLLKLATSAYEADDTAKATERFGKILAIDPSYPQPYYYLGLIKMREGAKEEAKSYLEHFLQLAPHRSEAATAQQALQYLKES